MNLLSFDDLSRQAEQPSAYSIYKRIGNLFALIIALTIAINLWLLRSDHAQNWYDNQSQQLGRSLAQQAAMVLSVPLSQLQAEQTQAQRLVELVAYLKADRHVLSASVFDNKGRALANTPMPESILEVHKQSIHAPLVFVEEIRGKENTLLGYVRIQLNKPEVMRFHGEYQDQLFEQTRMLIFLAILLGIILTRGFYKWRIRRYLKRDIGQASN